MSGDAYRGNEEAARARLAELQLERKKRIARFLFAAVLCAINLRDQAYYFQALRRMIANVPKLPHVNELKDPEPLDLPENKAVQRVLTEALLKSGVR